MPAPRRSSSRRRMLMFASLKTYHCDERLTSTSSAEAAAAARATARSSASPLVRERVATRFTRTRSISSPRKGWWSSKRSAVATSSESMQSVNRTSHEATAGTKRVAGRALARRRTSRPRATPRWRHDAEAAQARRARRLAGRRSRKPSRPRMRADALARRSTIPEHRVPTQDPLIHDQRPQGEDMATRKPLDGEFGGERRGLPRATQKRATLPGASLTVFRGPRGAESTVGGGRPRTPASPGRAGRANLPAAGRSELATTPQNPDFSESIMSRQPTHPT